MDLITILRRAELFQGLTQQQLESVAGICHERTCTGGELIVRQGEPGDEMFLVCRGLVEVSLEAPTMDAPEQAVVQLGDGQIVGEMALVDRGPRSATVRVVSDGASLQVMTAGDFLRLCEEDHQLGYVVMRNMAADLSFKLRHRNLAGG